MRNQFLFIGIYLLLNSYVTAQMVSTVAGPIPRINNGLVVHPNGDIYASDLFGSGFNGNSIHIIAPDGTSELLANGLSQPAGLAFAADGTLYVAEFTSGEISRIEPDGTVQLFASGLSQPADMVFDKDGGLFVTNYGNGTISKIDPTGNVSDYVHGLSQPVGLAIDENQNLYSANLNDGKIYQIDTLGNKTLLTKLSDVPVGFMTFAAGRLYVCSTGGHKIYAVDLTGDQQILVGSSMAGTVDGDITEARFTNPDGIASSPTGDTLYVSENNTNLLRRIILNPSTNSYEELPEKTFCELRVTPNPGSDLFTIYYQVKKKDAVSVDIYSERGKLVRSIVSAIQQPGDYQYIFQASAFPVGRYYVQIRNGQVQEKAVLVIVR